MSASRSEGAKPSQMRALREAIIFSRHMFSIPELDVVISSRRCLGASLRGEKRRARKRADPLTVKNLRLLHAMLKDLNVPAWDRVFAGATLCCSYMRTRWSDFQHATSFQLEYGDGGARLFLEYTCEVYKTVNSKFFAGQPIRFVAPGRGIVEDNWLDLWYEARLEIGIEGFVPPLPTPGPSGGPTGALPTRLLAGCKRSAETESICELRPVRVVPVAVAHQMLTPSRKGFSKSLSRQRGHIFFNISGHDFCI